MTTFGESRAQLEADLLKLLEDDKIIAQKQINNGFVIGLKLKSIGKKNGSQLSELFARLSKFSQLQILDLSDCSLHAIPPLENAIFHLSVLYLHKNHLKDVPKFFTNPGTLQQLTLYDNALTKIPDMIFDNASLQSLYLAKNEITEIPSKIDKLGSLRTLNLDENAISQLPEELGNCFNLVEFSCAKNNLTSLPDSFKNLQYLQNVNFNSNQFEEFPHPLGEFTYLSRLDISDNLISKISIELSFPSLMLLDLSKNRLKDIPYSMSSNKRLGLLNLSDNLFEDLPVMLLEMEDIRQIQLENNPFKPEAQEVWDNFNENHDFEIIKKYLRLEQAEWHSDGLNPEDFETL